MLISTLQTNNFMKKIYTKLLVGFLFVLGTVGANAQTLANYTFSNSTSASLTDMTSGTTNFGNLTPGSYYDDVASSVTNLPFPFYFMGNAYGQFSVNSNGQLRFGSTVISGTSNATPALGVVILAPMAGDNAVKATGRVVYKTTGVVGSQVMTVSWEDFTIPFSSTNTGATMQLRLYEGTGIIEFVYGDMYNGTASTARSIFLGSSNTATTNGYVTVGAVPTWTLSATNTTNTFTSVGSIPNLSNATNGSRIMYTWTPGQVLPADPITMTFTGVGLTTTTINWVDNSTDETNFALYRSTDGGTTYTLVANIPSTTTLATGASYLSAQTGLTPNTTYTWKVVANKEGVASSPGLIGSQLTNSCSIAGGTYTVGATGTYTSVANALTALIANGITGAVVLELQTDYVTEGAITFGLVPCASVTNTITIRPAAAVAAPIVLTSAAAAPTFNFNGGQFYIIDGRNGGAGTNKFITIANSSTTGQAVQFINEGTSNVIKYCTIQGVNTSTTSGVIVFSTTTGTNGNDNNTIDNCDIKDGATTPTNGIYSLGTTTTAAQNNSGNTISNCNIFNNFVSSGTSAGISIQGGNTDWTITGNSFYQTASRTATATVTVYGITIANSTSGNNFVVTNNFIGGNTANAGGTAWTITGTFANRFNGIGLSVGTTTASSIQGNTIANIAFSSTSSASTNSTSAPLGTGAWGGIYVGAGSANIGTTSGNTIGATTGTGSITFTQLTSSGGTANGIGCSGSGIINISNNNVGAMTATSGGTLSAGVTGIISNASGTVTINLNTIGSTATPNSMNGSAASISTSAQVVSGIVNTGAATAISITNNTIANLNNAYPTAPTTLTLTLRGISSTSGVGTVTGNTVRNLTNASPGIGTGTTSSTMGILYSSTTAGNHTISLNTIQAINNSTGSAATFLHGIYFSGPSAGTNVIAKNLIYGLSLASTSTTATITGITIGGGVANTQNNMIRLGLDAAGASLINSAIIGIDKNVATNNNLYHNSVYIGGSGVTVNANSIAFRRSLTGTDEVRDNIFVNQRSNGAGTGKHYVVGLNVNTTLTLSHNVYHGAGTGFTFGYVGTPGSTDHLTYGATWNTASNDASSLFSDPLFVAPAAVTPNLHVQVGTPAEGTGFNIASVTDDFDGQARSTLSPTDIGADAGDYALIGVDMGATALVAPAASGCYTTTEIVTVTIKNYSGTTIDFSVNNVTVNVTATGGYSSSVVLTSGTLVAGATQNVTMPATINMSVNGTYTFNANTVVTGDLNAGNDAMGAVNRVSLTLGGTKTVGVTGADYISLTAAVADYNTASCITGPIVFELISTYSSASETFPITINANAIAGTNTLTIRPASGQNPIITGNSTTSLLKLNGADYVIIDGSNNGTTSKNLTITNTNTATSGNAVIWIASASASDGATNNIIKNCIITGNSETTTLIGVFSGGTASISTTGSALANNSNNIIQNNTISKSQHGVFVRGVAAATLGTGLQLIQNTIGTVTAGDGFSLTGITAQFQDGAIISNNEIQNQTSTSTANTGGIILLDTKNGILNANNIHNLRYTGTSTGKIVGIHTSSATYNVVGNPSNITFSNNMVYDLSSTATSTSWNTSGISNNGGYNDKYYFNSVYLTGQMNNTGTGGSACFANGNGLTSTNCPVVDMRNNIFYMNGSSAAAATLYAHYTTVTTYSGSTLNYNDLLSSASGSATAQLGRFNATNYATLATWQTATSQEANSISSDPKFISATNLHINTAVATLVESAGTPIAGITTDYDNDTRNVTTPDIGADEGTFIAPPANDIQATAFISPLSGSSVVTGASFSPQASFTNNGTATQTSVTVRYRILDATLTEVYNNTQVIASIATGVTTTVTFASTSLAVAGTYTIYARSELVGDAVPANDEINGTLLAQAPLCGTYMVGASQPAGFQNLTQAIGKINSLGVSCAVVFELQTDYSTAPAETFPLVINAYAGASATNTFTIRPASGVTATISGTSTSSIIKINGADYVTIDGSNNATTSRNLTIENISISTNTAVIWVSSLGTGTGATSNTIKNTITKAGSNTVSSTFGIYVGGTVISTSATGDDNDDLTILNNSINKSFYGIYARASATGLNNNLVISSNSIGSSTAADYIGKYGIDITQATGASLSQNTIFNIIGGNTNPTGMLIGSGFVSSSITRNMITGLRYAGTGGYGGKGIDINTGSATSSVTISNNMISDLLGDGWSTLTSDAIVGIRILGTTGGLNIYDNSVHLTGNSDRSATATLTAALYVVSTATGLDIRNNIFANSIVNALNSGGKAYSIYSAAANTAYSNIDFNNYYPSGTQGVLGFLGSDRTTLAAWRTGTAQDINSLNILPNFVSATDLHLVAGTNCGLDGYGTPITGITVDYDNATRDVNTPDIGADEFNPTYSGTLAGVAGSSVCENKIVSPLGTTYATGVCDLIARLVPSGANPVTGKVNVCVTTDATQQYANGGEPYVQRHYDMEPVTSNQTTTSATVTLYFTDAEFALYNSNNPVRPPLPTVAGGANTDPNRANVKITQYHGPASSYPSNPSLYTGTRVLILPSLANVFWNGTNWAITFDIIGFSGFYLHTSLGAGALPITINYFNGSKQGSNHLLNWKVTCQSTPRATMTLERSADSRNFTGITTIVADAARCNQPFDYTDVQPLKGMNYYRLKMVDDNGAISYSGIVALLNAVKGFEIISIAPNPVTTGNFKLNVTSATAATMQVIITDMQGRTVNRQSIPVIAGFSSIPMNVSNLAAGTYSIQAIFADEKTKLIRFVKQ